MTHYSIRRGFTSFRFTKLKKASQMAKRGLEKTLSQLEMKWVFFADGTTVLEKPSGLREVNLLNQKKVHYYPEGRMAWMNGCASRRVFDA